MTGRVFTKLLLSFVLVLLVGTAILDVSLRPIFEHTRGLAEKDLALALAMGERLGVDLPFAGLTLSTLAAGLGVPHEEEHA